MSTDWNRFFEEVTRKVFGPVAARAGLNLNRVSVSNGVFEIAGDKFTIRIRRGIGHLRDFAVTLARKKPALTDYNDFTGEVGLGRVAQFYHKTYSNLEGLNVDTLESAMRDAAVLTEELCIPYAIGSRDDFDEILEILRVELESIKHKYENLESLPGVHRMWPTEKDDTP